MFTKLLKHEFRTAGRTLGILSLGALLAGVFGFFMSLLAYTNEALADNNFFGSVGISVIGLAVISLVAYLISSVIILYKQFYTSKFTDEGYLTFTLPVTTHQILLSSILNVVLWSLIIVCVTVVSVLLLVAPSYAAEGSSYISFSDFVEAPTFLDVLADISGMIYSMILPFLAITLGALWAKKRKLGAAFAIGYGINMAVSFFSNILLILAATAGNDAASNSYLIIDMGIQLLVGIGGYFLMHHLIDKKMNL